MQEINPLTNARLAFIGCGVMAEAIIAGLLRRKLVGPDQIAGSHPRQARREELHVKYGIEMFEQNREAALEAKPSETNGGSLVVLAVKLHGHHTQGYEDYAGPSYDDAPAASAPSDPTANGSSIVVDVGGRVHHPGLVTLPIGARVADAIRAAGGPLRHRELARIDLAAHVADGQLLMVGVPAAADSSGGGSAAPVSLSTASLEQLETLPGVGPVTAQKIVDWRTTHGGFTSVSQLEQVSGIGPARYSQLSPLVTP